MSHFKYVWSFRNSSVHRSQYLILSYFLSTLRRYINLSSRLKVKKGHRKIKTVIGHDSVLRLT